MKISQSRAHRYRPSTGPKKIHTRDWALTLYRSSYWTESRRDTWRNRTDKVPLVLLRLHVSVCGVSEEGRRAIEENITQRSSKSWVFRFLQFLFAQQVRIVFEFTFNFARWIVFCVILLLLCISNLFPLADEVTATVLKVEKRKKIFKRRKSVLFFCFI